jgi:hypothetical protein
MGGGMGRAAILQRSHHSPETPEIWRLKPISRPFKPPSSKREEPRHKTLEELFEELLSMTHCAAMDLGDIQMAFNRLVLSSNLRRPIF